MLESKPDAGRWRVLVGCFVCQMGLGLGAYVFSSILKPVVADFGWSRAAYSVSVFSIVLGMSVGSPMIGALTERLGARLVFTAGITVVSAALVFASAMESLWQFYAIGFLLGIGVTGLGDVPVGAIVAQWFAKGRGLALGIAYSGSSVGGAIVPIVAAAAVAHSSWRVALLLLAAGGWLLIVPFVLICVRDAKSTGHARSAGGRFASLKPTAESLSLNDAIRTPSFWLLAFALFAFFFYNVGVVTHLVAFLSDAGFSDAEAARGLSAALGVGVAGKIGVGLVADRVPKRAATLLTFGFLTVGSVLLLQITDYPALVPVFVIVHGLAVAAENVVFPLVVAECFGVAHLAHIYGTLLLVLLPGGVAGPIFAGFAFDNLGGYHVAFATFAVLNVCALAALALLRPLDSDRGTTVAAPALG